MQNLRCAMQNLRWDLRWELKFALGLTPNAKFLRWGSSGIFHLFFRGKIAFLSLLYRIKLNFQAVIKPAASAQPPRLLGESQDDGFGWRATALGLFPIKQSGRLR